MAGALATFPQGVPVGLTVVVVGFSVVVVGFAVVVVGLSVVVDFTVVVGRAVVVVLGDVGGIVEHEASAIPAAMRSLIFISYFLVDSFLLDFSLPVLKARGLDSRGDLSLVCSSRMKL